MGYQHILDHVVLVQSVLAVQNEVFDESPQFV